MIEEGGSTDAASDVSMSEAGTDGASITDALGDTGTTDEPRVSQSCYIQRAEAGTGVVTRCAASGQRARGWRVPGFERLCRTRRMRRSRRQGRRMSPGVVTALPIRCPPGSFYQEEP